jgi:hypothetical protein
MSKLDSLLLEALLFKDKTPPSKKTKANISFKDYVKLHKEFKEFEKLMKEEEDKKKPKDGDKLTFWQKTVLLHIGALGYFATLALLFRLTFH